MNKQVQEESAEPTTFEIPEGHEVLRMRDEYEEAVDNANAKARTLKRKHTRRIDAFAKELGAEMTALKQPLQADLDARSTAIHEKLATFVPYNPATQELHFVSNREVAIRPKRKELEHTGEDNCPACKAESESPSLQDFLQQVFGGKTE